MTAATGVQTMKILLLAGALLVLPTGAIAQIADHGTAARLQTLEDRAALKALVDTFSVLADRKDVAHQVLLFTEDATVESISDGRPGSVLAGRKQIGDAFSAYLANFQTVYHMNGQQTVELHGDTATGVAYCLVTLISETNGKRVRMTAGVRYDDSYVRRDGQWRIARRISHFAWRDQEQMSRP